MDQGGDKTLSHTVFQRLKACGKEKKILCVGSHSNQPGRVSLVYFNRFAYEIGLNFEQIVSCRFNINKLLKFPAKIRSLIEGPAQNGIFALTEEGAIWKLNLPTIAEIEKPPTRYI